MILFHRMRRPTGGDPLWRSLVTVSLVLVSSFYARQDAHGQPRPILQLRPDGPLAPIHQLQFAADGSRLYAAGDDKYVQVWRLEDGQFARSHSESVRHMIGPGPLGAVRAMSVSDDGRYVAAGGVGAFARHAKFSDSGIMISKANLTDETLRELGTVSLFDVVDQQLHSLEVHMGYVLAADMLRVGNQYYLASIGNEEQATDCPPEESVSIKRSLCITSVPDGKLVERWDLPETRTLPSLVAWLDPTGANDLAAVRLAVTLSNGREDDVLAMFRVGVPAPRETRAHLGWSVDHDATSNRLCVSSYRAVVLIDPANSTTSRVDLTSLMGQSDLITSIRWVAAPQPLVAMTIRDAAQPTSQHRLQLLDVTQKRFLLGTGLPIGNRQNPMIAVDAGGKRLAVTADVAAGVKIFGVNNLRTGNQQPSQVLKPDFHPVDRATLATVDGKRVLSLALKRNGVAARLDFVDDGLRDSSLAQLPEHDNKLSFVPPGTENPSQYQVGAAEGVTPSTPIKLESTGVPLGRSVRWKLRDGMPIAAIGYLQHGGESQSSLSIYDLTSGRELRRLNGHQQVVSSIAYSEDHRFLVTTSTDGVVCVWNLADLAEVYGRRGALLGVNFCLSNGALIVSQADAPSSLRVGDRLEGLIDWEGNLVPYASTEQLALDLSHQAAGTDVRLRVQRDGSAVDVSVSLGQATDERKPVFSFVTHVDPASHDLRWLAWTPNGPFQSSDREIEELVGWHFNPIERGGKATFAPFKEYREQFSGDGLVGELLASGRLPDVWPPPFTPTIAMNFVASDGSFVDEERGEFRTDKELRVIQASVTNIPSQFVNGVSAQLAGSEPIQLSRSPIDPLVWTGDVSGLQIVGQSQMVEVSVDSDRVADGFRAARSYLDTLPKPEAGPDPAPEPEPEPVPEPEPLVYLPEIYLENPTGPSRLRTTELLPGQRIKVDAIAALAPIPPDAEIVAILDGHEVALGDATLKESRVTGSVQVKPGVNRVAVRVKRGADSVTTDTVEVEVMELPTVIAIRGQVQKDNSAQLEMDVVSAGLPKRESFRLRLGSYEVDDWRFEPVADPNRQNRYRIMASDFSVQEGENLVRLDVLDASGRAWERHDLALNGITQPKQPRLLVNGFLDEEESSSRVLGTSTKVEIAVTSDDLKRVRCRVGEQSIEVPPPKSFRNGVYFFEVVVPLKLGVNRIEVTATSEAGLTAYEETMIERLQRPAEVVVTRFTLADADSIPVKWIAGDDYEVSKAIPDARGNLEGTVRVSSETKDLLEGSKYIRAWVNGFLQSVERLQANDNDPYELRFSVPVLLSLKANTIQLELPGLASSEGSVVTVDAPCLEPSREQSLHLLVVSSRVSFRQRKEYEQRVLDTLGVKNNRMPAFSKVVSGAPVYPAITGANCVSDTVRPLIENCRLHLNNEQAANNAVLIYFEGEELRHSDGRFCLMTRDVKPETAFADPTLITSTYLGGQLEGLKCANLVFLDVAPHIQSAQTEHAGDPSQPGLGVLRLVQTDGQARIASPFLLGQIQRILPNIAELGQLSVELQRDLNRRQGLAVSDSIPAPVRRMRFGGQ